MHIQTREENRVSAAIARAVLITMAVLAAIYIAFLGYVLARLWYYKGALDPPPKRYIIMPPYLREKLLTNTSGTSSGTSTPAPETIDEDADILRPTLPERTDSRARLVTFAEPDAATTSALQSTKQTRRRTNALRNSIGDALKPSRWRGSVLLDPDLLPDTDDLSEVRNTEARNLLLEEKRLSRMPAFVADDCGDGRLFPDVLTTDPTKKEDPWKNPRLSMLPLQKSRMGGSDEDEGGGDEGDGAAVSELPGPLASAPKFRSEPGNYMTMGLRKLDVKDWLLVDNSYKEFWEARARVLRDKKIEVLQVEREAEDACVELMREVVRFLTTQYPAVFEIVEGGFGGPVVRNKLVGEQFKLQKPWDCHPLEMCARLAMEDFNILAKSEFTGEHRLIASATLFPAGWSLRSRIGKSITDLHGPVPLWKDLPNILNTSSYFTRLNPSSLMSRNSFFIQIKPDARPLSDLLFIQEGKDFFPGDFSRLDPRFILVRREKQTFRRLPESGAVVFTVKTSVQRLVDLEGGERRNLVKEIKAWPSEIATYKGRDLWEKAVVEFCERGG